MLSMNTWIKMSPNGEMLSTDAQDKLWKKKNVDKKLFGKKDVKKYQMDNLLLKFIVTGVTKLFAQKKPMSHNRPNKANNQRVSGKNKN